MANMYPFYLFFPVFTSYIHQQPQNECKIQEKSNQESSTPKNLIPKFLNISIEDLQEAGPQKRRNPWTAQEDQILRQEYPRRGSSWKRITNKLKGRNMCMAQSRHKRLQFYQKKAWTPREDEKLRKLVETQNSIEQIDWKQITKKFEGRTPRQVKDRYENHSRSNLLKGPWTYQEEMEFINIINEIGKTDWKEISRRIPHRSLTQLKNQYFSRLKKISNRHSEGKRKGSKPSR